MLLPFGIESSISIYNLIPDRLNSENLETNTLGNISKENFIENNKENINLEDKDTNNSLGDIYNNSKDLAGEENNISNKSYNFKIINIKNLLVVLWTFIVVLLTLKNLISYIIFKNSIIKEKEIDNFNLKNYLEEGKASLNIKNNIKIKTSNKI